MAIPTYTFFAWNNAYSYDKWDVVYGSTLRPTQYFYSTIGSNLAASPDAPFVYTPTATTRNGNVMRVTFTQTGSTFFQQGSIVAVADISPDSSANFTGVALAGGSGYVDYLNAGLDTTNGVLGGTVTAPIHPYWTTGFYWIPSWQTEVTHDSQVINTQLGEGYSQRMNPVINSNSLNWNMTFAERSDKETMALLTFLQVAGGATSFDVDMPVGRLYNMPGLKYINQPARHSLSSYGLNNITVPLTQVFDVG